MRTAALRAVVVVVGLGLLALVGAIATNERTVIAYAEGADGEVFQLSLTCASIAEGGGLAVPIDPDASRPVDAAPEGVELLDGPDDVDGACPEEGPVWLGVLAFLAVLVVGAVIWAWMYLGDRARRAGEGTAA